MKKAAAILAGAALSLFSGVAGAEALTPTPEAESPGARPIRHERRGGLVVGGAAGVGFAGASGYPNSARFLNNPEYYSESPLLVGYHFGGFVMGALTDWLNIGPSIAVANFESERWKSTGFGVGLRTELFPFVRFLPSLSDLSLYGQLGVGMTELRAKGPYPTSDGVQSFFGIGVHHEWKVVEFAGTHTAAGPFIEYDSIRTTATERHWLSMGLRLAFYTSGRDR